MKHAFNCPIRFITITCGSSPLGVNQPSHLASYDHNEQEVTFPAGQSMEGAFRAHEISGILTTVGRHVAEAEMLTWAGPHAFF